MEPTIQKTTDDATVHSYEFKHSESSKQQNLLTQCVQVHLTCVNCAKIRELKLAWDIMHKMGLNRKTLCYCPIRTKS